MPIIEEQIKEEEEDFNGWVDSINFVDKDNNIIPVVLEDDESDDPEGDRGEEE